MGATDMPHRDRPMGRERAGSTDTPLDERSRQKEGGKRKKGKRSERTTSDRAEEELRREFDGRAPGNGL